MRKLYILLAGIALAVTTLPASARSFSPDVANFTFTVNSSTNNVVFANNSILGNEPGVRRAFWSFGDGSGQWTGGLDGTQHLYQSPGTFTVCLKIYRIVSNTSDSVLSAEVCKTLVIQSICQAKFETVAASSTPLGKYFVAQPVHSQNKKPVRICWTFGDTKDTCIQYSTTYTGAYGVYHLYSQPGAYNVCVNILYDGGCEASNCHIIETGVADSCRANFESPATSPGIAGKYFVAQPWHNHNKKPVQICWTFGDNKDTCIQYPTSYTGPYGVYHLYSQPGAYNVCVKIVYDGGCEAHNCHVIQIAGMDSCKADFERIPVTTSNNPLQTAFKALPWHNHDKRPVQVCWTFGDNRDTCIQYSNTNPGPFTVSHTYANAGNYEVCVKILYDGGCEARKCKIIEVRLPDSCKAGFERIPVSTANDLLSASFRALPWHNNNKKPSKICWTFGDNRDTCINYGTDYNGQYIVNHHYQQPGQYEVCVKIFYYGGCEASNCRPVVVPQAYCSVKIFMLSPSVNSLSRVLYTFPHSVPNRPIDRICWNFGDGTDTCIMATSSNPPALFIQHEYPAPGVYRTCVRVVFQGGCVAENCIEVAIRNNSPLCGGYMSDSLIAPRTFKFKAFAIHAPNDPVVSYRWTFGDGSTAVGQEVTHAYNAGGEYRVCLVILTQSGCETKICNTVRVPANNQAVLQLSPNPVVNTLHALFLSMHNETVTIKITNSSGIVVRTFTRSAIVGANNWDFDLASLLPGTYLFTVQSPNQSVSAIFIKQ